MAARRDPARLRQSLAQLRTTVGGFHPSSFFSSDGTSMSAVAFSPTQSISTRTPISVRTPASALHPYNPQEWAGPVPDRPEVMREDAQPAPPPPYSPAHSSPTPSSNLPVTPALRSAPCQAQQRAIQEHQQQPLGTPPPPLLPPPPPPRPAGRDHRFALPFSNHHGGDADIPSSRRDGSTPILPPPALSSRQWPVRTLNLQISAHNPSSNTSGSNLHNLPAPRRTVSAGPANISTLASARPISQTALPPPPPCPPLQSRSQSTDSPIRSDLGFFVPPGAHRHSGHHSSLEPVPPTPQDWSQEPNLSRPVPVKSDTEHMVSGPDASSMSTKTSRSPRAWASVSSPSNSSPAVGLTRASAVRHDKPISERRADRRRSQDAFRNSVISRTQEISAGKQHDVTASSPPAAASSQLVTPPFSPCASKAVVVTANSGLPIVPKTLPSPPFYNNSASSSYSGFCGLWDSSVASPAIPAKDIVVSQISEQFSLDSVERWREFARREFGAQDDAQRVRMFAEFIVSESRIRRERYATAIAAMGTEVLDLTRDLFRPMSPLNAYARQSYGDWTPHTSHSSRSQRNSFSTVVPSDQTHQIATPLSLVVPRSLSPVVAASAGNGNRLGTGFMPSLSPILSMSVSDKQGDKDEFRGRSVSRWWEPAADNIAGSERSPRESKYMGLPRHSWVDTPPGGDGPVDRVDQPGESYLEDDKTPHAVGFAVAALASPLSASIVTTPRTGGLDISRLISLPPPYPRHHPAVNNNHPELAATRALVRVMSDLSDVETIKEKFLASSTTAKEQHNKTAAERRQLLVHRLQQEVASGTLTYAGAAALESAAEQTERDSQKELARRDYEKFQVQAVTPLHEMLTSRIERATGLIDDFATQLSGQVKGSVDALQEAGDDQPELLEKLTLLKWVFEARETLHRAIFSLLSERNDRYREVVLTPYRLAGNAEKVRSAEAFFAEDEARRQLEQAQTTLQRTRALQTVVESNVVIGVEAQLSAFWDIAPPLSKLLDKIPADLTGFTILVPAAERAENPAYDDHPLQYLFGLVAHAEKSSYQFIEAQTNLMCLLHEVKEAVTLAKVKVWERQPPPAADDDADAGATPDERAQRLGQLEQQRLTDDLQERVCQVQDQWRSALGQHIAGVKERVREELLQTGGWDESLEDAGVGVA